MHTPQTPRVGSESTCADSCIRLASGALIDLANPDPALLRIQDIAQSLAHTVRFSGHCPLQPTVAQHSLAVEHIACRIYEAAHYEHEVGAGEQAPRELLKAALMHDAAEALVGDLAGPAKRWLRTRDARYMGGGFDTLEGRATDAIVERFDIDFAAYADIIHEADVQAYYFEAAYYGWSDMRPYAWVTADPKVWLCYGFIEGVRVAPGHNGEMPFLRRAAQLGIA